MNPNQKPQSQPNRTPARKAYRKPALVDFGSVSLETQSGYYYYIEEEFPYYSSLQ